uniref:Uncharacterized protein n=1 Tax=Graphocephala atropunctata TaxID=36148 RepID=A0A1B6L2V4_9HEMI
MECDSVHSNIEEKLKNKEIYLPSQYHNITKEAISKPFPYKSHFLSYSFFKNFSKPESMVYTSIRPGRVAGDPTVHDIKAIVYKPNGQIETKIDLADGYQALPRRPKKNVVGSNTFSSLYSEKRKIQRFKWNHLQELKFVLPEDTHSFYDSLSKE